MGASIHCENDCFNGACIKCLKPQCVQYYDCEFDCEEVDDFAGSKNSRVCPDDAIRWSNAAQEFVIDSENASVAVYAQTSVLLAQSIPPEKVRCR